MGPATHRTMSERSYHGATSRSSFKQLPDNSFTLHLTERRKEMFLFYDTLSTLYLRLYGVRHMIKDPSDSGRGNLLPPHGLLFLIRIKEHWLEREIAQWVHHEEQQSNDPLHHDQTLFPRNYISLPYTLLCSNKF